MKYPLKVVPVALFLLAAFCVVLLAQTFSLHSKDWYATQNPSSLLQLGTKGGALSFIFPSSKGTAVGGMFDFRPFPLAGDGFLSATFSITAKGSPVFQYDTETFNTCVFPAHVRFYFQANPALWTNSDGDTFRWFSSPISYTLGPGTVTLTAPLTPDQWSTVYGRFGNADAATLAGFQAALASTDTVGLALGGGCFFGHGVYVTGGTAQFTLSAMSAF